jgi:hypothetical protein
MSELKCKECGIYLGEIIQGSIDRGSCLLCDHCIKDFRIYKSLAEQKYDKSNAPHFLKELFEGNK